MEIVLIISIFLALIIRLQQEMLKYLSLRQLSQVSVNFECMQSHCVTD